MLSKNIKIFIFRTVVLQVVLYGCETWPLTSMEEHRLRVFENRLLSRIFGPKRDEKTGEWKKLHNEELSDYVLLTKSFSDDKIEKNEMGGACGTYGKRRGAYRVLVGKSEGQRPLGRARRR